MELKSYKRREGKAEEGSQSASGFCGSCPAISPPCLWPVPLQASFLSIPIRENSLCLCSWLWAAFLYSSFLFWQVQGKREEHAEALRRREDLGLD